MKSQKLNLGCGGDLLEGYVNVDISFPQSSRGGKPISAYETRKASVEKLDWIENDSVEEIRAQDVLDHIPWRDLKDTLIEWHRVLASQGRLLLLKVPDFERFYTEYLKSGRTAEDWQKLQHLVDMLSYHQENLRSKNLLDRSFLSSLLQSIGFEIERSWAEENDFNIVCRKK